MISLAAAPQPVRVFAEHEHLDLVRGINRIHDVAWEIGRLATPELSTDVRDVLHWVDSVLEPHIAWEEGWLYPDLDARAGTEWATRAARFDHQQIREMIALVRSDQQQLHSMDHVDRHGRMRCHLFGLEALLRAHIEREERFLLPLLDAMIRTPSRPDSAAPSPPAERRPAT
jgi:hemerythrin-like domain-containing protein